MRRCMEEGLEVEAEMEATRLGMRRWGVSTRPHEEEQRPYGRGDGETEVVVEGSGRICEEDTFGCKGIRLHEFGPIRPGVR